MEVTICPVCVPPLPPVYGTVLLTLAAVTPWPKVPALVAVEQLSAVIVPTGNATVLTGNSITGMQSQTHETYALLAGMCPAMLNGQYLRII